MTSGLISGGEVIHIHASGGQFLAWTREHVLAQHPRAGQNPGEIDVEQAKVIEARVDQSVGLIVRRQNPVRRGWNTFGEEERPVYYAAWRLRVAQTS